MFYPKPVAAPLAEPYGPGGHLGSLEAGQHLFDFALAEGHGRFIIGREFFDGLPTESDYLASTQGLLSAAAAQGQLAAITVGSSFYLDEFLTLDMDAVHIDYESFPDGDNADGTHHPTDPEDFDRYKEARELSMAAGKKMYVSIGWH